MHPDLVTAAERLFSKPSQTRRERSQPPVKKQLYPRAFQLPIIKKQHHQRQRNRHHHNKPAVVVWNTHPTALSAGRVLAQINSPPVALSSLWQCSGRCSGRSSLLVGVSM